MIHFTCDRCRRSIDTDEEVRYLVQVEVRPVFEETPSGYGDADLDHLMELDEILERIDEEDDEGGFGDDGPQRHRYDLCPECYKLYLKNPLGRDTPLSIGFSAN